MLKDIIIGSRVHFLMCRVYLHVDVLHYTYTSYIVIAHHGVWLLVKFGFWWPIEFDSVTNQCVLIMIKHFSKWLKLVPLLGHNSERTTCAFIDRVFSIFGAPTKVLIDQGVEFHWEFQKFCQKALNNHWMISRLS